MPAPNYNAHAGQQKATLADAVASALIKRKPCQPELDNRGWLNGLFCIYHDDHRKPNLGIHEGTQRFKCLACDERGPLYQLAWDLGVGIEAIYPFDNGGEIVRFHDKVLRPRRPDGNGGTTWNWRGLRRHLYRQDEALAGDPERVALVEGMKDVDTAFNLGGRATCNPFGAAEQWISQYVEPLRGRRVCIVVDPDAAGEVWCRNATAALNGVAAEIRVLRLGVDLSDWVVQGGTLNELTRLLGDATPVTTTAAVRDSSKVEHEHFTDVGNARRLVDLHGADIRYCHPWGKWLVWDETRWGVDDSGEVDRRAKDTVREMYSEAADFKEEGERKRAASWAMSSETRARIDAMIALARSEPDIPIVPNDMDADPWLLNVLNGTLDLRTGELRNHRRDDSITKLARVDYDPGAQYQLWTEFLQRIMAKNEALITFLQRAVGYSLSGDVSEQVLFLLYGTGANGKSTFLDVLLSVLGDYGMMMAPGLLLSSRHDRHPTEVADLFGARFAASVEVGEGRRMAEERMKQLTGGDRVKARRMHEDFWEFAPTHKLWIATNHKPIIRGTDLAIWRRIQLVPFTVSIPKEEQDRGLPGKLKAEAAGILAWAVQGCLNWQREGLATPVAVDVATGDYREEMDILADFIAERCVEETGAESTAGKLYDAYAVWAKVNGDKFPLSKRAFGLRLGERGFESVKLGKSRVRSWRGIRLSGPDDAAHEHDDVDLHEPGMEGELPQTDEMP